MRFKSAAIILCNLFCITLSILAQNLPLDEILYLRDPELRFSGEQVRALQKFLLFHGSDLGPDGMDGWFGTDTQAALIEYQRKMNLKPDGIIMIREFWGPLDWLPKIRFRSAFLRQADILAYEQEGETGNPIVLSSDPFEFSSFYGSVWLQTQNNSFVFKEFSSSPLGRFITSIVENPDGGIHLWIYDLLSENEFLLSPEEAFIDESTWLPRSGFEDMKFTDWYWIGENRLICMVSALQSEGESITAVVDLQL
jgi:hypothetical protein